MVRVQALCLRVQVAGVHALLRRQLQRVRKRLIPLSQKFQPVHAGLPVPRLLRRSISVEQLRCRRKPVLQIVAQSPQQFFIRPRVQPPYARVLFRLLDQPHPPLAVRRIENQNADIHPLVAHQVRRVPQHPVSKHAVRRTSHLCLCAHCASLETATSNSQTAAGSNSSPTKSVLPHAAFSAAAVPADAAPRRSRRHTTLAESPPPAPPALSR